MKQATPIYANWPERLLAYLLDQLIIVVPVAVLAQPFVQVNPAGEILIEPAAYMVIFVVNLAYHSYCVASRWQATLGMRILSMHVARVDGRPLHVRDAIERFLAFFMPQLPSYASFIPKEQASMLVVFLSISWFMPILLRADRMGLHDRLCGTRVLAGKVVI